MDITYKWNVTALKKAPLLEGLTDVITHLKFEYTGTDSESGESFTFSGACPLGLPTSDSFTPLEDITHEDAISWAKSNHETDHMNEVIEQEINDKITPKNHDVEAYWLNTD